MAILENCWFRHVHTVDSFLSSRKIICKKTVKYFIARIWADYVIVWKGRKVNNKLLKTVTLNFIHYSGLLKQLHFGSFCFHLPVNRIQKKTSTRICSLFETSCTQGLNRIDFLSYLIHLKTKIEQISEI